VSDIVSAADDMNSASKIIAPGLKRSNIFKNSFAGADPPMVEPEKCHAVCVAPTRQFDLFGRIAAAQKPVGSDDKGRVVGARQMENSF
ncbi:MAG TPA: hypothetical protein PLG96_07360, partial [Flexilinea sp.]|nr:hypothetical protein [Flexilinea sp.]